MKTIRITLPEPHPAQRDIINNAARFNVIDCGRRFGKTQLGIDRAVAPDILSYPIGWFSPTYKMLLEAWRSLVQVLQPITTRKSEQERRIELITGGLIECWSLDHPDAARGRKYRRAIIDEAALVKRLSDVWNAIIRPTLVDYSGDAFILSTPKGRNGFWQMFQWGLDPAQTEWKCWKKPTYENPHISRGEIDAMRAAMPERIFMQEVMAEFIEDAGGIFRGVQAAATAQPQEAAIPGHQYVFGVDWGKHNDFTVISVIDVTLGAMAAMDRFNQIDYTLQSGRLKALASRFNPSSIIAEANAMGEPIIERLQMDGLPVQGFTTTNATKGRIIEDLSLAFENGTLQILDDAALIGELMAFEASRLPSGLLRYSAPSGIHDDCVMSLALANSGKASGVDIVNLGEYIVQRGYT